MTDVAEHLWINRHVERPGRVFRVIYQGARIFSFDSVVETLLSVEEIQAIVMKSIAWQCANLTSVIYCSVSPSVHLTQSQWKKLEAHLFGVLLKPDAAPCPDCNGTRRTIWWEAGMMQDCQRCSRGA